MRELTNRQEKIIHLAFERGYYNVPKNTTIKKLSRVSRVAPSTLAEIIQRAERKIIGLHCNK